MSDYNYSPDTLVKLTDGRVMTWAQFQDYLTKQAATYSQQMTAAIEQLAGLANQLYSHSSDVWYALGQLMSDMSGIEDAIGNDDTGTKILASWQSSWPNLQQIIQGVAKALDSVGGGLETTADAIYQAEENTLGGLSKFGVTVDATDPRLPATPPPGQRGRYF